MKNENNKRVMCHCEGDLLTDFVPWQVRARGNLHLCLDISIGIATLRSQ
jgi:hypothetical protein